MRKIILCLAIIAVASGCIGDSNSADQAEPDMEEAPETSEETSNQQDENTVRYTDSGFQPNSLTIEQDETVTWVDESSTPMWVASDRHPQHTDYAGSTLAQHCENGDETEAAFDQCQTGDSYSFKFEKTGTWGYHNHRSSGDGGEIVVERVN